MIKFKITPERAAECLSVIEYLALTSGNLPTAIRVAPRFMLEGEEYAVKITLDEDGDMEKMDGLTEALMRMTAVTPKRLEKLSKELTEAAKALISPPSAGG